MPDIDITDLVAALEDGFVTWAVDALYAWTVSVPFFSWVALPVVSQIYRTVLRAIIAKLASLAAMQGFFYNTALNRASKAKDFVGAVNLVKSLPDSVTEVEYAKAERNKIDAFNSLVVIT